MPVRILHAHTEFPSGRAAERGFLLMNALGGSAEHTIISAQGDHAPGRLPIGRNVRVDLAADAPPLRGGLALARLFPLSRYLRRFDLVLTYGWSAFDAVMARYLFGGPPLIHHQDEEGEEPGLVQLLYLRLGLSSVYRLVVPWREVEKIACSGWRQPSERVERISEGVDVGRFGHPCSPDAIPGLTKRPGEVVIGTVAALRPEAELPGLVRVFAAMKNRSCRLVIAGEGPETERIMGEARDCGVADRLLMPGSLPDAASVLNCFDIFARFPANGESPMRLVEAAAAGLPVVALADGEASSIVADDNRPLLVDPGDEAAYTAALDTLADRPDLRRGIGRANRGKAQVEFDRTVMMVRYARLYGDAIGAPQTFLAALA